jgi:hypothetical protein
MHTQWLRGDEGVDERPLLCREEMQQCDDGFVREGREDVVTLTHEGGKLGRWVSLRLCGIHPVHELQGLQCVCQGEMNTHSYTYITHTYTPSPCHLHAALRCWCVQPTPDVSSTCSSLDPTTGCDTHCRIGPRSQT